MHQHTQEPLTYTQTCAHICMHAYVTPHQTTHIHTYPVHTHTSHHIAWYRDIYVRASHIYIHCLHQLHTPQTHNTHTHIYIYIYIRTHSQKTLYTYTHAYMHACVTNTRVHTWMHICMHARVRAHILYDTKHTNIQSLHTCMYCIINMHARM